MNVTYVTTGVASVTVCHLGRDHGHHVASLMKVNKLVKKLLDMTP